jgi:hypothetical protein
MSPKALSEILSLFETVYGLPQHSPEAQRVWMALLEPLDDRAAKSAAVDVCRTSPYPPKPADLWLRCARDAGTGRDHAVPGPDETRALLARLRPPRASVVRIGDILRRLAAPERPDEHGATGGG